MGWKELDTLSKKDLLDLAKDYSNYVMDFQETHDGGSWPVCIAEFMENEWQSKRR